jgi:hypothetical protein
MCGGAADRIHHSLIVVVGISGILGVPNDFFTEDGLAVDYCAGLAVAGAEIKPNTTAVEMPSQRDGSFLGWWYFINASYNHLKRPFIHRRHEIRIEVPRTPVPNKRTECADRPPSARRHITSIPPAAKAKT